jgi:hypothetical protein
MELNSAEDKMLHQNECRNMRRKTVVLVSRANPSRQKVAAAALDTAFPGIPSHNREPEKAREKGSTVAKEMLRRQMTRCSGSIAYSFARTIVCVKARPGEIYPKSLSV